MKNTVTIIIASLSIMLCSAVSWAQDYKHIVSEVNPFGSWNPNAPEQLKDFESLIGTCDCKSVQRKQDGTWLDTVNMTWTYRYIMDGKAVLDETLKEDGGHTMSVRQYNADSAKWYVTFFSSAAANPSPSTWAGGKQGEDIVLYLSQKAPNGMDGFSRLTFYDITDNGYKWKGEWVDAKETISFPFWRIYCTRKE